MTSCVDSIGIDLGATASLIAVAQGVDARPIAVGDGAEGVPSVVHIDTFGINKVIVGQEALVHLNDDPDNTATGFIASLGGADRYHFPSSGRTMSPEELAAEVLRTLRLMARWQLGHDITAAMLAVPAAFDSSQREALARAARLAGFSAVGLVEAPVAAAAMAAQSAGPVPGEALWLVYDWGGTTFEVSLLRHHANGFEVVANLGDGHLGSGLVDWAIVEECLVPALLEKYSLPDFTRDNRLWAQAFGMLRVCAEVAKIELSSAGHATIALRGLFYDDDGALVSLTYDLHGDDLERLIDPYVGRTVAYAGRLLGERGLSPDDLDRIVLVGGFCRNPHVRRRLQALGGAAAHGIDLSVDPASVVARGAALLAGLPGAVGAAEPPSEAEAGRETAEAVTDVPEAVAEGLVVSEVTEGAGTRPEADGAAEPGEATAPAEAEAAGQAETTAAAEYDEERPADLPPAPPPLERYSNGFPRDAAVGILRADRSVEWVFETGEPAPTPRRRVSYITVAELKTGPGQALRVPVVRGSGRARYSVIGAAVIAADEISADLPSGSKVVLGIKVDGEYRITVSAYLPATKDVWDDTLKLGYAEAFPDERPAEPPVVPVDAPEPKAPAPPAAEEETPVAAETLAAPDEELDFLATLTPPVFDLEPSPESPAEPAEVSAAESAPRVPASTMPAPPPAPGADSDWIDLDLTAGARGRRPADGAADEEILQRARRYLLANQFEEAAHEVGRLGDSETLLAEALDVLARVRLHQGHLDIARSLWIQADELNPGVKRYAEGLEQVTEAGNRGHDDGLRRRRTIELMAVGVVTLLVVILLGVYACHSGGPAATPADGSPSPTVTPSSTAGAVRENTQPPSFPVRVRGTRVEPTRTAAVLTFERGLFDSGSADISGPGRTMLLQLGNRLETHTEDLVVRVIGHTDSKPIRGPGRYADNVELGMARAVAVLDFLRRKAGLPYTLFSAATAAATRPLASNASERGRARNRTVVIEIAETVR